MAAARHLKEKILELRRQNIPYRKIAKILQCNDHTVYYHCCPSIYKRERRVLSQRHPFYVKMINYKSRKYRRGSKKKQDLEFKKAFARKLKCFIAIKNEGLMKAEFTLDDIINKFGDTPKCYITGDEIDVTKPRSYHFDHIMPSSKGGDNSLSNLGICTRQANLAKSDMTLDELEFFCKKVLEHHGYSVEKKP